MIEVYFDGACEPFNPKGISTYGYVIKKDGNIIHSDYGLACNPLSEESSNNVAEYTAMIKAMKYLLQNHMEKEDIVIYGDSQLTIRQMLGIYSVNAWRILPLYKKAKELENRFSKISYKWIPREENNDADTLSHIAYDDYIDAHPDVLKHIKEFLATNKQKQLLDKLNIKYGKYIGKREASNIISKRLKKFE